VNPATGSRAQPGDKAIWEAFKPGTEPGDEQNQQVLTGIGDSGTVSSGTGTGTSVTIPATGSTSGGTGGLY
jgi:penicillin-binding protein 1A